MKKLFLTFLILAVCLVPSTTLALTYHRDVVITSPDGIWTDARAYSSINAAIASVGADDRTIVITNPRTVTTLTVPSNVTLDFRRNGSITNSGQLTINTKNIIADNRQIFTGVGNIDFADGTRVLTGWFSNIETAFSLTGNDTITLIVSKPQDITASYSPGDNVILKWESPGNILTINGGVEVGNLKNIEAGQYQIFAGAGDFDFLDGAELKLNWFNRLSSVLTWVESEEVTIIVNEDSIVQVDVTTSRNEIIKVIPGGVLNIDAGVTFTINGSFSAGLYQVFSGNGSISFGNGAVVAVHPEWWGAVPDDLTDCLASFVSAYASISKGIIQLSTGIYRISGGLNHNVNDIILRGSGRYSTFIKNYGADPIILVGNVGVTRINRFGIEDLALLGTDTATNGIYLQNAGYGNISRIFIEDTVASGIKFQDTINIDLIQNNIYGPGTVGVPAGAGIYGYEFINVLSNNTTTRSANNYLTGWYSDVRMDDYAVAGFNSTGDIYETAVNTVYVGTNNRNISFIGPSFENFTKAFILNSGSITILNTEGINWGDVDISGMGGAERSRGDWVIMIPAFPSGGTAYDPDTSDGYHKIGHMISNGRGIISHDAQSRAFAYTYTEQTIPTATEVPILFNEEEFDEHSEFDLSGATGTVTATIAGKLVDSGASFTSAHDGATVWNITDNTYATVTAVDDANTLSIDVNIMVNGEDYRVYQSKFVAKVNGYYLVTCTVRWKSATTDVKLNIYRDALLIISKNKAGSSENITVTGVIFIVSGQVLTPKIKQSSGGNEIVDDGQAISWISIHKIS